MWGFRIPQSLWPERYHFQFVEIIQRSPYKLKRRVRQGRSSSFRACQHDSHDTGIWISSCTIISEILEADKNFPRKFKRTTRYSKSPSCTVVNGKETGWMKLQMEVETPLILVSGRQKSGNSWRSEENQSLTTLRTCSYFPSQRQKIVLQTWGQYLKHASKGQGRRTKKSKSQVESFGTKAENILAGQINWRICMWRKVMVAKITD